jgi:hypothetical protein
MDSPSSVEYAGRSPEGMQAGSGAAQRSACEGTAAVYVKTTLDGRVVEVIGRHLCLAGVREADSLVALDEHPNRAAILKAVPLATHMAGRLPLTLPEASVAQAALRRAQDVFDGSAPAVRERLRRAEWGKAIADGAE